MEFNGVIMEQNDFLQALKDRLSNTDINLVKRDVAPFIKQADTLDIWSNDYFLLLADKIIFKEEK